MRTTLTIDDHVYRRVQGMARSSGKRLGEVVSELLRQRLEGDCPVERRNEEEDGFDFVTMPATGRTIRSEDVERILEEEGV
jgi:predicted CopG family antitoxin